MAGRGGAAGLLKDQDLLASSLQPKQSAILLSTLSWKHYRKCVCQGSARLYQFQTVGALRLKHHARVPAMANSIWGSETGAKWKLKQDFTSVSANPLKRLNRKRRPSFRIPTGTIQRRRTSENSAPTHCAERNSQKDRQGSDRKEEECLELNQFFLPPYRWSGSIQYLGQPGWPGSPSSHCDSSCGRASVRACCGSRSSTASWSGLWHTSGPRSPAEETQELLLFIFSRPDETHREALLNFGKCAQPGGRMKDMSVKGTISVVPNPKKSHVSEGISAQQCVCVVCFYVLPGRDFNPSVDLQQRGILLVGFLFSLDKHPVISSFSQRLLERQK